MLKLAGLQIEELSGPVSVTYLFPKAEAFHENAEKGIFLPHVLLFGDSHESEENRCEDCDEQKGCFKLESRSFIGALNEMAKEYPIDFYTEIFSDAAVISDIRHDHSSRVGIIPRVLERTAGCWDRTSRRCAYRNIKWHKSDPRKANGAIESNEYMEHLVREVMGLGERSTLSPPERKIEGNLYLVYLQTLYRSVGNGESIEQFVLNLSKAFEREMVRNRKSIVYKQIRKSGAEFNLGLYLYRSLMKKISINYDSNGLAESLVYVEDETMALEDVLGSVITAMRQGEEVGEESNYVTYKKVVWMVTGIYNHFVAMSLVDLYYSFRMIKKPQDSVNSDLAIGHFGQGHCEQIRKLLTEELQYEEMMDVSSEIVADQAAINRCIRFDFQLDIDSALEKYRGMRAILEKKFYYITEI